MPGAAVILLIGFWTFLRAVLFGSAAVALENVALRHQLLVLQRSVRRPRLARGDRVFWVWLSARQRPCVAIPIAVAPADATHTSHHASEDRIDQSEKVLDRDSRAPPLLIPAGIVERLRARSVDS
jgi:hypothetical protein